jgi:hypothetical protein
VRREQGTYNSQRRPPVAYRRGQETLAELSGPIGIALKALDAIKEVYREYPRRAEYKGIADKENSPEINPGDKPRKYTGA